MRIILFFVAFSFIVLFACKKYQASSEAFFIQPGSIKVSTTANQGSGQHKITDLWVYVNGQFTGVYPIQNRIPIITKGKKVTINVFAGIRNNGISETRVNWPFYDETHFDTLVEQGKTIQRNFTFKYNATTTFKWLENFDNQGQSLIKSINSIDTTVSMKLVSGEQSLENRYLELMIKQPGIYAQIESYNKFELPTKSSNVYLEFNYLCNNPFSIGLIGDNTQVKDVYTFNTHDTWNKAYVQLANTANTEPVSSSYKICFYMAKIESSEPRLLLDNIKLVYL